MSEGAVVDSLVERMRRMRALARYVGWLEKVKYRLGSSSRRMQEHHDMKYLQLMTLARDIANEMSADDGTLISRWGEVMAGMEGQ